MECQYASIKDIDQHLKADVFSTVCTKDILYTQSNLSLFDFGLIDSDWLRLT